MAGLEEEAEAAAARRCALELRLREVVKVAEGARVGGGEEERGARLGKLEAELAEVQGAEEAAERASQEAVRRLTLLEAQLERAEAKLEGAQAGRSKLEEEVVAVRRTLEVLTKDPVEEEKKERWAAREEELRQRSREGEARAEAAARAVLVLQGEVGGQLCLFLRFNEPSTILF